MTEENTNVPVGQTRDDQDDSSIEPDDDLMMYYGAASGQQRGALRRLEPEGVMISHATHLNKPWNGDYKLFIDSGGYHHMITGGGDYDTSDEAYLQYVLKHRPHLYALRDYPCEPDLLSNLGRTVEEQQERTVNHHIALLNKVSGHAIADTAVACLQGWTRGQYLDMIDTFRDHGILTDHVAIGSVCRRGKDSEISDIILAVRDALPSRCKIHAFGVKGNVLRYREVVAALDSVDSCAYDYTEVHHPTDRDRDEDSYTWRDCARAYLNWRHRLLHKTGTESLHGATVQTTLTDGGVCK